MAIGNLDIGVNLDTASFTAGINSVKNSIAGIGADVAKYTQLTQFAAQATQELINAVVGHMRDAADQVSKFNDLAQTLNTTLNTGTGLEATALGLQSLGVDAKASTGAVENFGKVISDAFIAKSTPATRALTAMGVSVKDSTGAMRPYNDILQETINRFGNFKSDADKAAVAQAFFGQSAGQTANILQQTGTAITQAAGAAASTADAFGQMAARMDDLKNNTDGLWNSITAGLARAFTVLYDAAGAASFAFGEIGRAATGAAETSDGSAILIGQSATHIIDSFADMTARVIGAIVTMIEGISNLISIIENLARIAQAAANIVGNAFASMFARANGDKQAQAAYFDGMTKGFDDVKTASDAVVDGVKNGFGRALQSGQLAKDDFLVKFKENSDRATESIKKTAAGTESLSGALKKLKTGGGGGGGGRHGLTADEKDAKDLQRWTDSILDAIDPTRKWMEETAKLTDAFEAGLVTGDQYDQILARISKQHPPDDWTKSINDFQKGLESFGDSAASSLASAIVNGDDLGETLANLAKQLAEMAIQTLILKPLFASLFGGGVGGGGGIFGSLLSGFSTPMGPSIAGTSFDHSGFLQSFRGAASGAAGGAAARTFAAANSNRSATIGSIQMNITPEKGATISDSENGRLFGAQVTKAVQQILVKESRPGGILRRA